MFVLKKSLIRSCFFKIFITDLPVNYCSSTKNRNINTKLFDRNITFCKTESQKQTSDYRLVTNFHKVNYQIIRPLLDLSRSDITLICKKLLIPVYPDKSNQCIKYSRNRIRKQLLPTLKLFYNPQIEEALFQFAEIVRKEQDFINILSNAIPHNFLRIVKKCKNTKQSTNKAKAKYKNK